MKRLRPFTYFDARTLAEAAALLAREGDDACVLAGGTDLLVRMKSGAVKPRVVVNVKRVPGLDRITVEANDEVRVGALVTLLAIEKSPLLASRCPALVEAAAGMASPSIRNMATIGGNIGRASPASDLAPSLIALSARVVVEGAAHTREVPVEQFCTAPGKNVLKSGELITGFLIPKAPSGAGATYLRTGRRDGMDCTLAGVAVFLSLAENDGSLKDARIALSAVAAIPARAARAEEILRSGTLTDERMREAARAAAAVDSCPISDVRATDSYRRTLVEVLTYRGLARALQLAKGSGS